MVVAYMTHTETLENGVTTIKLIGKLLREKHLGMWNDKIDVNITQPIVITGEDALED